MIVVLLAITACNPTKIQSVQVKDVSLSDSLQLIDKEIASLILPYKEELEKSMNEVLNTTNTEMIKATPEGLLGNFVADLCLKVGQELYTPKNDKPIDICVLNNGGLRTSLPHGNITRGKVFELMPFENQLVVLTLPGSAMQKLIDYTAQKGGIPVSNMTLEIEGNAAKNVTIGDYPFNPNNNYKVITSDYLAHGGDEMNFFSEHTSMEIVNIKIRDAIIKYMVDEKKNNRVLTSKLDNRIINVE